MGSAGAAVEDGAALTTGRVGAGTQAASTHRPKATVNRERMRPLFLAPG
ncbi:hypothetical protein GCM10010841_18970 [Deinococcus aerophilus]|uniref:Uncharacterized protein n=1 Tax=Deinococcus aerophilus TaxID=522488 RepID=A0ABQ2GT43_9DEIO|nr:hypothetical protein GCM10010841_18970 [Deinococcus aerophilus]